MPPFKSKLGHEKPALFSITYKNIMPFNKIILSSLICLASLSSQFASANDSSFGDDNGSITLKYQPDISMDKESLYLSENNIQVDYIFTNTVPFSSLASIIQCQKLLPLLALRWC